MGDSRRYGPVILDQFRLALQVQYRCHHSLGYLTMEITMQTSVALFAQLFALLFLIGGVAMAQTTPAASPPTTLSKAALRKQDKQECTKQAEQQNIARRNRAGFVRQCMSDRQGARKATAK
jgi:malonyl CoA-acyl carrier protein transacylase